MLDMNVICERHVVGFEELGYRRVSRRRDLLANAPLGSQDGLIFKMR